MIDTRRSASTCTALAVDRTGMFINVCLFVIFASLVTYLAYQFFNPPLESDLKVYKDNQVILKCVTDAASNTLIVELIEEGKLQQRFEVDGCERLEPTNKKSLPGFTKTPSGHLNTTTTRGSQSSEFVYNHFFPYSQLCLFISL